MNKADKEELRKAIKDLFEKFGLDAYDIRLAVGDRYVSFQGDSRPLPENHAILTEKEKKDVD